MPQEITEDSTTDEVHDYVDEVVKEVNEERAGDDPSPDSLPGDGDSSKGDARLASEHAYNEHKANSTNAPAESGRDTVDSDVDETTGKKTEGPSWLDDDLRAEVSAHGIDDEELADFQSREELERALRFFDRSALDAGRKALSETDSDAEQGQNRNEKGQFDNEEQPKEKPPAGGGYEIGLDEDIYDEELVSEFTRMRDHYETRLETLESRFLEADARLEEQQFDSILDSLGHTDLFGKTGKENSKQLQRRQDLNVQVKAMQIGLQQLGREVDLDESLVNRAAKMVFADDLGKKELKSRTRRISRQSNGRQGGGATRPQDPRDDPREAADRLYKELERA